METWAVMFGNNALAITAGEIQVRPGLGRHRLVIPIIVRPTMEAAYGHTDSRGLFRPVAFEASAAI